MSQVFVPSSGSGSGVQNPMTVDLDANGFSLVSVKDMLATRTVDGRFITASQQLGGAVVNAGTELTHSDPFGTIGFYGVPPTPQLSIPFPIVGGDPNQNEATINQICTVLQALGLIS